MMSASVWAGCVAANRLHIGPPSDTPSSTACLDPTASSTARTSSMRCSRVGRCVTGSDSPVPRLSNRISRENEASRLRNRANDGSFQKYSRCDTHPITKTRSTGPLPQTWYAMLTSPLLAYWTGPGSTAAGSAIGAGRAAAAGADCVTPAMNR